METSSPVSADRPARGRRQRTSHAELERVAFALFAAKGFDQTTIDDIAEAAGIGRRTFFNYYASKNDLVWGRFDHDVARLRRLLAAAPPEISLMDALREAVVEFNRYDEAILPEHRTRMRLILGVPALQADSTLRYAQWATAVAEFVAARTGHPVTGLVPRLVGQTALGAAITAYRQWLDGESGDLTALIAQAMSLLTTGFTDEALSLRA
ncbi:mycofactocin system transcriptional regulator [Thermopolyspora sp. NPDC052614]|uniref:mycofactocin system transcriptional regulator n=1 Tax=Thermopolyspora sp. NPDC052614 TaxID=3155682 RepID=UPI00344139E9